MSGLELSPEELGEAPFGVIKTNLDRIFGKSKWSDMDIEEIGITLGFIPDSLLIDKIGILQALELDPALVREDPLFFLYYTEVLNNCPADFDMLPMPTSLEVAYSVYKNPGEYDDSVKKVIGYLLREDGYCTLCWPFTEENTCTELFAVNNDIVKEDAASKTAANHHYIEDMER